MPPVPSRALTGGVCQFYAIPPVGHRRHTPKYAKWRIHLDKVAIDGYDLNYGCRPIWDHKTVAQARLGPEKRMAGLGVARRQQAANGNAGAGRVPLRGD